MAESSENLGKASKKTVERKEADLVSAWNRFLQDEGGCYPPRLAAAYLRMTIQAVYSASEKGWIRYFKIGRERFYSARDVHDYRWTGSRKFKDARSRPRFGGRQDISRYLPELPKDRPPLDG